MQREFPGKGLLHRTVTAHGSAAGGHYEVAVSSEQEVARQGFLGVWREVLDHSPSAVELDRFRSGSAAVLVDHRGDQVGVIESASLRPDRVLRARIRFSASDRGREVEQDVADGIRRNISVGYIPKRAVLVEHDEEKGDLWRVTLWEPVELSIVAVPADTSVGVGRSAAGVSRPVVEAKMSEHAAELAEMGAAYGVGHRVADWIRSGTTPDQASAEILRLRAKSGPAQPAAESLEDIGASRRDLSRYSYARAIRVAAGLEQGGFEAEVSRELERFMPGEAKRRGGVLVPLALTTRTMSSNTATKGAESVFDQAGELIELLRNRTWVIELGARVLNGLTSPVGFPKQSAAMTAYWVGENPGADVAASDPTLAQALLNPKTMQASTAYSRQFLVQSSLDVESFVRADIAAVHARALDYAGIHGLAAGAEPTGVYKAVGVGTKAMGGVPTFGKLVDMVSTIAGANGDTDTMGFITTPAMAGLLAQTLVAAAAGSDMQWSGPLTDGRLAGLRAVATNQCSATMSGSDRTGGTSHALVCGVWSELLIGLFGALEVVVDPYTSKKKGLVEVTSFQMADLLVRHGESFCKATGATLT